MPDVSPSVTAVEPSAILPELGPLSVAHCTAFVAAGVGAKPCSVGAPHWSSNGDAIDNCVAVGSAKRRSINEAVTHLDA